MKHNHKIALMMGAIDKKDCLPPIAGKMEDNQIWIPYHGIVYTTDMNYHKSWDWLMPAVVKSNQLIAESLTKLSPMKDTPEVMQAISSISVMTINLTANIDYVYNQVARVAEWYYFTNKKNEHGEI